MMLQRISTSLVAATTFRLPTVTSSSLCVSSSVLPYSAFSSSAAAPGDKSQKSHGDKRSKGKSTPSSSPPASPPPTSRPSSSSGNTVASGNTVTSGSSVASPRSKRVVVPALKRPRVADIPPHITDSLQKVRWLVARNIAYVNQPFPYTEGMTEEQIKAKQEKIKAAEAAVKADLDSFQKEVEDAVAHPKKPEECKTKEELFVHLLGGIIKNGLRLRPLSKDVKSFAPQRVPSVSEDARNIYHLASKFGGDYTTQRVYTELASFEQALNLNPEVRFYLVKPTVSMNERLHTLRKAISGRNLHPLTQNMIQKLFLENKFYGEPCLKLAQEVKELFAYNRKYVEVEISTAQHVKPRVLAVLISTIQRSANPAEKYHFTHKVDKNLIGGFLIKIGDYVADYSMKNEVRFYQSWLEGVLSGAASRAQA